MAQFSSNFGNGRGAGKKAVRMGRMNCITVEDVEFKARRDNKRKAKTWTDPVFKPLAQVLDRDELEHLEDAYKALMDL